MTAHTTSHYSATDFQSKWKEFETFLQQDGHTDLPATKYGLRRIFSGITFEGKRVLDVGSGRGLMSIYATLNGAHSVVSMEPELAGSQNTVVQIQRDRIANLGLNNIDIVCDDFNTWAPPDERFDILLSFASINHIYESPKHALRHSETYQKYLRIVCKMYDLLNDKGTAIITDACRYAFFSWMKAVGIRRPWRWRKSSINWRLHQNPRVWRQLFLEGGFNRVEIEYPVPYRLRHLEPLLNTCPANFFLQGSFILRCHR